MKHLMITWTDVFYATGDFFQWLFKIIRALGQGPNVLIGVGIVGLLAYWTMRLRRYKRQAAQNGTIE